MEERLDELMREIRQSGRRELDEKIADLKTEVNSAQQKTSQDLVKKIENSTYQFKKKGQRAPVPIQFDCQEAMGSAKEELAKLKPTAPEEKAALKKAEEKLNKGTKALAERQKHIKVADRSEFGWATVNYYWDDPLASDSDDEKNLNRAEKEARKDAERAASKRRRGAANGGNAKRRRAQYSLNDPPAGPSNISNARREPFTTGSMTGMPQRQRGRELGPCFRCGCPGHIAVNCTTPVWQYPLPQPVVSSAEISKTGSAEPAEVHVCNKAVDATAKPVTHQGGVEKAGAYDLVTGVDDQSPHSELAESTGAITKYWEVESIQSQITDVQGRLKKNCYTGKKCCTHPHQYWTVSRMAIGCP